MSIEKGKNDPLLRAARKQNRWTANQVDLFLKELNPSEEFFSDETHEPLRIEKIFDLLGNKLSQYSEANQANHLLETASQARKKLEEEVISECIKESSLFFKNVEGLFDHHYNAHESVFD